MGKIKTHVVEKWIDSVVWGPTVLEFKEEKKKRKKKWAHDIKKMQKQWRITWCENLMDKFIIK